MQHLRSYIDVLTAEIVRNVKTVRGQKASASKKKLGQELYLDKQLCDVKIFCQDKIFYCHKLILSLRSEVFKRMLTGNNMIEATRGEINATKASAVTMEALLYFMYNYSMDEHEITVDLLVAADYYMVPDLVNQCMIHFASNLTEPVITNYWLVAQPCLHFSML